MSDYLAGWAEAARVQALYKRDVSAGDPRSSILAQRMIRERPWRQETNVEHENGYADGALAAFGHGDTDGARVGERQ